MEGELRRALWRALVRVASGSGRHASGDGEHRLVESAVQTAIFLMRTNCSRGASLIATGCASPSSSMAQLNRKNWRTVSVDDVRFEPHELKNQLLPTLGNDDARGIGQPDAGVHHLVEECRDTLDVVLPLSDAKREFLDRLLDYGEIVPSILTTDEARAERIQQHPLLEWRASNVGKLKGR